MFVVMAIFFATEVILLGMQYYTKDRLGDLIDKSNRVYELKTTFSEVLSAYIILFRRRRMTEKQQKRHLRDYGPTVPL